MINLFLKKIIAIGLFNILFLFSLPMVMSSENILSKVNINEYPTNNGDIEVTITGFLRFFVLEKNNRDE